MPKLSLPPLHFSLSKLFRRQQLAIGLDIGSHSVKVCEFSDGGPSGRRLVKLGSACLPEGAVADGILQDPPAVGKVIANLFNNLQIKSKKVAISMSGYSVIVKKINLAVMSEADLAKHINTEAEQYIPFDLDDVYLDFQDLQTGTQGSDRTDVMLVAAKKEVVDAYRTMLEGIGLQPVVVDVDAFAMENAFAFNGGRDENVALVDIGASKMSINILAHGSSILARDVVMGSRQITEQIQSQCGFDPEEAEAVKMGRQEAGEQRTCVEEVFAKNCTQWILEIKKAFDFYLANHTEGIDRLVLSGGGARIQGLDRLLKEETGVPVEICDPFAALQIDAAMIDPAYVRYIAPEMAIAAGLAIRTVDI